jgi:hypothetical protein
MAVVPDPAAEAARYALLRRLAPSFRHHLVVNLQPIGMICEVMDRRLRASVPDLVQVQDSAGKISAFSKAALHSSTEVIGWISPDDKVSTSVQECLRECSTLLATSLSFRGYGLRNEAAELDGAVKRGALRAVLTGALLYATDHLPAPADLVLTATSEPDAALVTLEVRTTQADNNFRGELNYRKLEWADLEALAAAEGVRVVREATRFELRFAWLSQG